MEWPSRRHDHHFLVDQIRKASFDLAEGQVLELEFLSEDLGDVQGRHRPCAKQERRSRRVVEVVQVILT